MKNILPVLFAVVFLYACSSVSVEHRGQLPPQPVKATYSWLPGTVPSNDIRVNNAVIDQMVHTSVERRLREKGYEKRAVDEADYLITWFGHIDEEIKEISLSLYYSRSGYVSLLGDLPENVTDGKVRQKFARGTLILDVLDRQDKKVLWRGSATNSLRKQMSKVQMAEYIDVSVAKILEDLP